jgi:tetratricopeptide (TPR) repeat protein
LYIQQGRLDEGLREVEPALAFLRPGGYRKETTDAFLLIGRAYRRKGNYADAQRVLEQLLQFAQLTGNQGVTAQAHSEIGRLLEYQERYPEALSHFEQSYHINQTLGVKASEGYNLQYLANLLWKLGENQRAHEAINQLAAISNQLNNTDKQLAASLPLLEARLALSERNFPQAIVKSRTTLQLAASKYPSLSIRAKFVLGLAQAMSGIHRAGVSSCKEAVTEAKSNADPYILAEALLASAQAKAASKSWAEAATDARQAREHFAGQARPESEWRAWIMVARSQQGLKEGDQARASAQRANEILTQLESKWGKEIFERYLTRPDVKQQRQQLIELLN